MIRLVFMVEEISMKETLDNILPKIFSDSILKQIIIIPHEGKKDLEQSIPRKLRAWQDYSGMKYQFIILRDKDRGDCIVIKNKLKHLCLINNRSDSIIRIVCEELESWFLGDLEAIEKAIDIAVPNKNLRKYRNPDLLSNASEEIRKICHGSYQKVGYARKIAQHLSIEKNKSKSFNLFVKTLKQFANS